MVTAKKAAGAKAAGAKALATKAVGAKAAGTKAGGTQAATKGGARKSATAAKAGVKKTLARAGAVKPAAKKAAVKKEAAGKRPASLAKGKDPKGGLTAEGRRYFKEKEGLNLRPGVRGKADTPEKMVRKGSFLRRHFANPPGPVKDKKGQPTRQALQAAAWGEPVPQNEADEKKLAAKGAELLKEYHALRDGDTAGAKPGKKAGLTKRSAGKKG